MEVADSRCVLPERNLPVGAQYPERIAVLLLREFIRHIAIYLCEEIAGTEPTGMLDDFQEPDKRFGLSIMRLA